MLIFDDIEWIQAFPNEFWYGWVKHCTFINGPNFADSDATPHLCSGQKWTVTLF